jgi:WD40 repeat protein
VFGDSRMMNHDGQVNDLAFTPDGRLVAAASPALGVWDAATGEAVPLLKGMPHRAIRVAVSPDGRTLASGAGAIGEPGAEVKLWDVAAGRPGQTFPAERPVLSVAFAPGGRTLASFGDDGLVRFWDPAAEAGKALRGQWTANCWQGALGGHQLVYGPEGRHLFVANGNGAVYVLRLAPPPAAARPGIFGPAGAPLPALVNGPAAGFSDTLLLK